MAFLKLVYGTAINIAGRTARVAEMSAKEKRVAGSKTEKKG